MARSRNLPREADAATRRCSNDSVRTRAPQQQRREKSRKRTAKDEEFWRGGRIVIELPAPTRRSSSPPLRSTVGRPISHPRLSVSWSSSWSQGALKYQSVWGNAGHMELRAVEKHSIVLPAVAVVFVSSSVRTDPLGPRSISPLPASRLWSSVRPPMEYFQFLMQHLSHSQHHICKDILPHCHKMLILFTLGSRLRKF